jgi:ankyrin repeat protein
MYAAQSCTPAVLSYLVDHGASVDQFNFEGEDALTVAVVQNRSDNVKELVDKGAKVNHVNRYGLTPLLAIASSEGRSKAMQMLINCGADVRARTPDGINARQLAEYAHHWDIVDLLNRAEATTKASNDNVK